MATQAIELDPLQSEEQFGGDGFPDLPKELQTVLKGLLRKALTREQYARRQEVMEARKQRFYDRDVQYIYWNEQIAGFSFLPGCAPGDPGSNGQYTEVYPLYHPFLRALMAAMTSSSPGVHIEGRSSRTADTVGAEAADLYREFLEQANDIKKVQLEIARLFGTDGRVLAEVERSEPDVRFGVNSQGEPMTAELIRLWGVLETKVPITQNSFSKWPYAVISGEYELEVLQQEFPDVVDDEGDSLIKDSGDSMGEAAYARMARIGVLQGTRLLTASGETWSNLATKHIAYFRPAFFRAAPKQYRDQLSEIFPDGVKLIVCGDAYCASYNVSMDKRLRVAHSTPGDGQSRASLMHGMMGIQDTFNDCWNQQKEIFDYCVPEVYMDSQSLDAMAREERKAEPGAEVPVILAPGESIGDKVFYAPNSEVPQSMILALNTLSGPLAQLVTGMFNAAFGSGDEHQETAKGLMILKDSSLGQMGVAWGAQQQLIAESLEMAIRLAAESREGTEKIPVKAMKDGREISVEIEIANIQQGNWYAEVDTSFPDTKAMKRAIFTQLIAAADKNPGIAAILSLPENQELFKEFAGIADLVVPGANAALQQKREIEDLLKSGPIQPSPQEIEQVVTGLAQQASQQMLQGAPAPPPPDIDAIVQSLQKPTVPIDPEWDFHQQHIQTIQDWLSSQSRFDEEAKGNFEGIENVRLHGMEHKKVLQGMQGSAQGKPPSVSINYKDLPPDGQLQAAKEAGIQLNPMGLAMQAAQNSIPKEPPNAGSPS